ncbi:MAG: type II toxin-antitoxin system RelE/ParE family toxin [Flavobacteriales bacterium]|nr:type II toxin-antitoxin system RelE/ParE family toxin [Flavobacteriales bacterium]
MYLIKFKKRAAKELRKLPAAVLKRVSKSIDSLSKNPRPKGSKKLKGSDENIWRIRMGDYRILYVIEETIKIVNIRKVGHRKDIYGT